MHEAHKLCIPAAHDPNQQLTFICRLADALIDEGGIDLLVSLPRHQQILTNLSLVQVGITLIPSAFQKVMRLPPDEFHHFVGIALEHMRCSSDAARKNAAVFLGNALVQPAVVDYFNRQDGLRKLTVAIKASRMVLTQDSLEEPSRQERLVPLHSFASMPDPIP